MRGRQPRRGPADERVGAGLRMPEAAAPGLDEPPVAVAAQPDRPSAERLQPVQGLGRERTVGEVTVEHDQVGLGGVDIGQDRFEGGQVAVDVGQDRDPVHAGHRPPGRRERQAALRPAVMRGRPCV